MGSRSEAEHRRAEAEKRAERKKRRCSRLRFYNPDTTEVRQAPCQLWSCPWCGPKMRAELRARLIVGAMAAVMLGCGLLQLVLTLDPKVGGYAANEWNGTKEQAKYVSACQRKLLKRWDQRRRRAGLTKLEYFWVNEWQARGACHRHILLAAPDFKDMSRRRLGALRKEVRAMIPKAGFGQVCDLGPVRDVKGIGGYLAKYVTKAVTEGPVSCVHRYGNSKGFMPTRLVWQCARIARVGATSTEKVTLFGDKHRWWCHGPALEELARLVELRIKREPGEKSVEEVWRFLECGKPGVRPEEEAALDRDAVSPQIREGCPAA